MRTTKNYYREVVVALLLLLHDAATTTGDACTDLVYCPYCAAVTIVCCYDHDYGAADAISVHVMVLASLSWSLQHYSSVYGHYRSAYVVIRALAQAHRSSSGSHCSTIHGHSSTSTRYY